MTSLGFRTYVRVGLGYGAQAKTGGVMLVYRPTDPYARRGTTPTRLRALEDPRVLARIHAAEERVRNGPTGEDDFTSVDELELVIANLRAERDRALLEDQG